MNKPFSLYIHIPFCKSKCPYCDFYSARPEEDEVLDRYLAALCARLAVYGEKYGERLLHTVYFGGGTPSVFGAKRLCRVLEKVKEATNGQPVDVKSYADADLRNYFATILPNFDQDRVYTTDIRKLFSWYNILIASGITEFVPAEDENAEAPAAE